MTIDWTHVKAPTLDDFETIAALAYGELPNEFRSLTGDIVIRVADFADDDALDALDLESPFELLGLFQGVGHDRWRGLALHRPTAKRNLALSAGDPRLLGRE